MSVTRPFGRVADRLAARSIATMGGYVAALFVAELLLAQGGFLAGGVSHLLILAALLAHHSVTESAPYRRMLLALTLPSIMRLTGLTVTVIEVPPVAWYVMIGIPSAVGTLLVLRVVRTRIRGLLVVPGDAPLQVVIGLSGVIHGLLLYLILHPAPLVSVFDIGAAVAASVVLILFVVVLEEVVFRGVIQYCVLELTGSRAAAAAVGAAVYACMFVSADSPLAPLAMLGTGALFGTAVVFTDSLWGVIGAHAFMIIGLLIIWPGLLG